MVRGRREPLEQAAELRRQLKAEHGDDLDDALAEQWAQAGPTRSAQTYRAAMARNAGIGGGLHDIDLPERILDPEETVYDVAVGGQSDDTFPLLIVTDRRVLVTKDLPWRRWKIQREVPAAQIAGAELETRLLSGRIRVRLHQGRDISFRVNERARSAEVAALLQHLAAGGAPPL